MARVATEFAAIELFEETSNGAGWDAKYRQLDGGTLKAEVEFTDYGNVSLLRERGNRSLEVIGAPPEGMLVVFAPLPHSPVSINGYHTRGRSLFLLWPGEELHVVSKRHADVVSMHIPAAVVEESVRRIVAHGRRANLVSRPQRLSDSKAVQALQARMLTSVGSALTAQAAAEISSDLTLAVARALTYGDDAENRQRHRHRTVQRLALKRAREYIEDHLQSSIRISDICRYAGVSLSTLERLFQRELQILPLAYIRQRRLDNVRRALNDRQRANKTVAEIATDQGFNHLGRFATAYREQFGRYPSEEPGSRRTRDGGDARLR